VDTFAQRLMTFDHEAGSTSWTYTGEDMNVPMLEEVEWTEVPSP